MKEGGIGENAVEVVGRKLKREKVLMPHFTTAVFAGELDEAFGSFQSDGLMARVTKNFQIPTRPTTEIEDSESTLTMKLFQQRIAILIHIVIACAFPETVGVLVVVVKSDR